MSAITAPSPTMSAPPRRERARSLEDKLVVHTKHDPVPRVYKLVPTEEEQAQAEAANAGLPHPPSDASSQPTPADSSVSSSSNPWDGKQFADWPSGKRRIPRTLYGALRWRGDWGTFVFKDKKTIQLQEVEGAPVLTIVNCYFFRRTRGMYEVDYRFTTAEGRRMKGSALVRLWRDTKRRNNSSN